MISNTKYAEVAKTVYGPDAESVFIAHTDDMNGDAVSAVFHGTNTVVDREVEPTPEEGSSQMALGAVKQETKKWLYQQH